MGTNCEACKAIIHDNMYMKCVTGTCRKIFHLKCVAITDEKFESFTEEYKQTWICPECACNIPKTNNSNTPVRGITVMNKTFTPGAFVSTERGSGLKLNESTDNTATATDARIIEEVRHCHSEMISRMEEQKKECKLLRNRVVRSEQELQELRKEMRVYQEKVNKIDVLETKLDLLLQKYTQLESLLSTGKTAQGNNEKSQPLAKSTATVSSFVDAVKKNQLAGSCEGACGATKTAKVNAMETKQKVLEQRKKPIQEEVSEKKEDDEYTVVSRKSNRYPRNEAKRGGMTDSQSEIQGTERNKYLHIWRLQKDTKEDSIEKHVKNLCGDKVYVKIERVKHKTERDYASFIVTVPESYYDKICQEGSWPVNIEFAEWIWFRKSFNKFQKTSQGN